MTDEETRLNRVGAEICRVVLGHDLRIMDSGPEIYTEGEWTNFDPATNPTHNAMVMETFDNWIVSKQKSEFRKGRIYTCTIWLGVAEWFIGQADTEVLARARCYEKVWEAEKGER